MSETILILFGMISFIGVALVWLWLRRDNYENLVTLHTRWGLKKLQMGALDQAELDFNEVIRLRPEFVAIYLARTQIHYRRKHFAAAIDDLSRAISFDPTTYLYLERAKFHGFKGDLDLALADCNRAIELDPNMAYAYGSRGHTYFLMGRYDDALGDFQKALAIKTDHPFAVAGEAIVLHAVGRVDEAKTKWQALLQLDAKYQNADALQDEYNCAEAFVAEARKVAAL